jgi:hypothetical protein
VRAAALDELFFSDPATRSPVRTNLSLFSSQDSGASWRLRRVVDEGAAAVARHLLDRRRVPVNQRDGATGATPLHRAAARRGLRGRVLVDPGSCVFSPESAAAYADLFRALGRSFSSVGLVAPKAGVIV